MSSMPSVRDLELVAAIARSGSVGAAARELRVSQPSASQRLARVERACGVALFDRDTQGARPTRAGQAMAQQADHVLGHLREVFTSVRLAAESSTLVIGTFPSLGPALFPILDAVLPDIEIDQRVYHAEQLIASVAESSMDACFVGTAARMTLPRGLVALPVGGDELVVFQPRGVELCGTARQPFKNAEVAFATYDTGTDALHRRLTALGARARRGGTAPTTVAMARRRAHPGVVPRSAVAADLLPGETVSPLPFASKITLSMVTGSTPDERLVAALPSLRDELGLID
jgi:DNA-binding transcriptional LysR family regulator